MPKRAVSDIYLTERAPTETVPRCADGQFLKKLLLKRALSDIHLPDRAQSYQDGPFKKKKKKCCHSGPLATASSTLRSGPLLKLQMLRRPILGGPFPKQLNLKPRTLEMFSGSVGFQEKRGPVIPRDPLQKLWPPEMKSCLRHWLRYWYPNRWQKYGVVHIREWQFGKSFQNLIAWVGLFVYRPR